VSEDSPPVAVLQIQSPGVLFLRGAGVWVSFLTVCSPGFELHLSMDIIQSKGNHLAFGEAFETVYCTGNADIITVSATSQTDDWFRVGTASVAANMSPTAWDNRTIQLVKS
jgi:hypothetical protein